MFEVVKSIGGTNTSLKAVLDIGDLTILSVYIPPLKIVNLKAGLEVATGVRSSANYQLVITLSTANREKRIKLPIYI